MGQRSVEALVDLGLGGCDQLHARTVEQPAPVVGVADLACGHSPSRGSAESRVALSRMVMTRATNRWRTRAASVLVLALAACGTEGTEANAPTEVETTTDAETPTSAGDAGAGEQEERFPDVLQVAVTPLEGDRYEVAVTISSPYDTPERYADAWRVLDESGNELGRRELAHDHASEQPFTRQTTVEIPEDVEEITVEGRDQVSGYGGATVTVTVPRDG